MADTVSRGSSVGGAFLTAFLVLVTVGAAVGAGYWFVVKPQLDDHSRTLVSLDLGNQDLNTKVDAISEQVGGGAGGGASASAIEALSQRLDAIESATRANADALSSLRTDVLDPLAADVAAMKHATAMAPLASAIPKSAPVRGAGAPPIGSEAAAVVHFEKIGDTGGAWLAKALQEKLPDLRTAIGNSGRCVFFIVGHADRLGPVEVNERIGFKRAESVKATLEILFVDDDDFSMVTFKPSVSLGERDVAVQTDDEVANKTNRRVEIHVSCAGGSGGGMAESGDNVGA